MHACTLQVEGGNESYATFSIFRGQNECMIIFKFFKINEPYLVGDIYHHTHSFGQIGLVKPLS